MKRKRWIINLLLDILVCSVAVYLIVCALASGFRRLSRQVNFHNLIGKLRVQGGLNFSTTKS